MVQELVMTLAARIFIARVEFRGILARQSVADDIRSRHPSETPV
jgi:hypothetical protein